MVIQRTDSTNTVVGDCFFEAHRDIAQAHVFVHRYRTFSLLIEIFRFAKGRQNQNNSRLHMT